jgi:hypothetical protein
VHAAESPNLSVVVSTDDAPYVSELEDVVGAGAEIVVVSTRRVERAGPTVHVLPLESAYRRNRGLALAQGRIVAFLEDGQLPAEDWRAAVEASFASRSRPAAVLSVAQSSLRRGGNVAYDRARLLAVRGFPLFTGAQPGSAVPDLLALRQLAVAGGGVLSVRGMTLRNTGCVRPPDD